MTEFKDKCSILAELWIGFKEDENLQEFIDYNDLGLPLSYLIDNKIVKVTDKATKYVNETFDLLLSFMGIEEDEGYLSLDDVFLSSNV